MTRYSDLPEMNIVDHLGPHVLARLLLRYLHFILPDSLKCENDILKESLIASEHQTPYIPNHELIAVAFQNNLTPFIITHIHQPPTVKITADRRSFLKGIFPPAVLAPGSLTGKMRQNGTHWEVEVMGSVKVCPGKFEQMFQVIT